VKTTTTTTPAPAPAPTPAPAAPSAAATPSAAAPSDAPAATASGINATLLAAVGEQFLKGLASQNSAAPAAAPAAPVAGTVTVTEEEYEEMRSAKRRLAEMEESKRREAQERNDRESLEGLGRLRDGVMSKLQPDSEEAKRYAEIFAAMEKPEFRTSDVGRQMLVSASALLGKQSAPAPAPAAAAAAAVPLQRVPGYFAAKASAVTTRVESTDSSGGAGDPFAPSSFRRMDTPSFANASRQLAEYTRQLCIEDASECLYTRERLGLPTHFRAIDQPFDIAPGHALVVKASRQPATFEEKVEALAYAQYECLRKRTSDLTDARMSATPGRIWKIGSGQDGPMLGVRQG